MLMYKLTTHENTTQGGMKWEIGKTNVATGVGNDMCTDQLLHCYSDPYLAIVFCHIHLKIDSPKLYLIECSEIVATNGLKYGCKEQTPIRELVLPVLTKNQYLAFGIKCALAVNFGEKFVTWANGWLDGSDRSNFAATNFAFSPHNTDIVAKSAGCAAAAVFFGTLSYMRNTYAAEAAHYSVRADSSIDLKGIIGWVLENIKD